MNPEATARFIENLDPAFLANDPTAPTKQIESENVARIRKMYAAIREGDYGAFRDSLAEDVVLEMAGPEASPLAGRWIGREQVLQGAARNYAQLEDQRPEIRQVVAQGDVVTIIGQEKGRLRATGREYNMAWVHVFTFAGGKVTSIYGVCDNAPLIEAALPLEAAGRTPED
jgi:uncharacterized protein